VSAPTDIQQSLSDTGMLELSGELKNKYGVIILRPTEGGRRLKNWSKLSERI